MAQKKVLGRGLGAFFPEYDATSTDASEKNTKPKSGSVDKKTGLETKASTPKSASKIGAAEKMNPEDKASRILDVPVQDIRPNPYQPRTEFEPEALQELAESIRLYGLIQPVTVRYLGEKRFELISGERRLRASKLAGLS